MHNILRRWRKPAPIAKPELALPHAIDTEHQVVTRIHCFADLLFVRLGLAWYHGHSPNDWLAPGRLLLAWIQPSQRCYRAGPMLCRVAYCNVWEPPHLDCVTPTPDELVCTPGSFLPGQKGERPESWLADHVYTCTKKTRSHLSDKCLNAWKSMREHARLHGYTIPPPRPETQMPVFGYAEWSQ